MCRVGAAGEGKRQPTSFAPVVSTAVPGASPRPALAYLSRQIRLSLF
jgi:hypothetical protein